LWTFCPPAKVVKYKVPLVLLAKEVNPKATGKSLVIKLATRFLCFMVGR